MSANTFNATANKRQKSADEVIAAVDKKMQVLHAEQAATDRKCCACQNTLPVIMFGKDKSRKDGLAARCKPCNRLHIKGFTGYVKKERDTSLTPPRQINVMEGVYVPERGMYYRNDGNKHIKSVGF